MSLKVTLVKSISSASYTQVATVRGLGLRKMNSERILNDTKAIRGMVTRVAHLVRMEVVDGNVRQPDKAKTPGYVVHPPVGKPKPAATQVQTSPKGRRKATPLATLEPEATKVAMALPAQTAKAAAKKEGKTAPSPLPKGNG